MNRRLAPLCLILPLLAAPAWAQLTVTISSPLLGEGMERLQAMVEENLQGFSRQIGDYVAETFDKPLFMEGFARAAAVSVLVPGAAHEAAYPRVSLGSSVSAYSDDFRTLPGLLGSLPADSDAVAGACTQPFLLRAGFPVKTALPGLDLGGSLGFISARTGDYGLDAFSMGLDSGFRLGSVGKGILRWEALRLELGADFAVSDLSARFQTGRITQTVPVDPDGAGPLVPFNASFSIEPRAEAGVRSSVASARLQASSGITILRAVSLSLGAGIQAATATSSLSLQALNVPIIVEGYLADLVETPGTISVTGGISRRSISTVNAYLCGSLGFRIGSFSLSVPLAWSLPNGLGAGAYVGMEL